jgi:Nuclease-related domain
MPWLVIGICLVLFVVRLLSGPRIQKPKLRAEHGRGEADRRVRGPIKRTDFVSEEEWRTFADIKSSITGQKGESSVAREIARLGLPALHDVILSDSRGVTQVDHLVLGLDAITVIETKTFGGFITGDLQGLQWTQHLAGGTMRPSFQNPVRQNHRHCSAVREILLGLAVPIHGYIVSAGNATFCEELIGKVVPLKRLSDLFVAESQGPTDAVVLRAAWDRLVSAGD